MTIHWFLSHFCHTCRYAACNYSNVNVVCSNFKQVNTSLNNIVWNSEKSPDQLIFICVKIKSANGMIRSQVYCFFWLGVLPYCNTM